MELMAECVGVVVIAFERKFLGFIPLTQVGQFYTSLHPAPVLALGINPAGDPEEILPDGQRNRITPGKRHAASPSFYENNENDLIDCHWRENNIEPLLQDVLSCDREGLRDSVVKTKFAFRLSWACSIQEATPHVYGSRHG